MNMARFRKARKVRTMSRPAKRYSKGKRSSGSGFKGIMNSLPIMSFGYGLVRTPIAQAMKPLTDKLPLGEYNDEVVLGIGAYFLAKSKMGMVSQIGSKILDIEGYRAGELTSSKVVSGNSTVSGVKDAYYV